MPGIEEDRLRAYLGLSEQVNSLGNGGRAGMADALRDAVRMFQSLHLEYALFGAFAVAAYVPERRSTLDIDFVAPASAGTAICQAAPKFGFEVDPQHSEGPILRFRHRAGALLDILCDPLGFADLSKARRVDLPGVGVLFLADPLDVAYSKLRTQRARAGRNYEKRLTDRSDLAALVRHNPGIVHDLHRRASGSERAGRFRRSHEMTETLATICREVGVPPPGARSHPASFRPTTRTILLGGAILLAIAIVLALWLAH